MIGWLVALGGVAFADWTLEGRASADRAAATADGKAAKDEGYKSRVVRRLTEGVGWEYVVKIEGLADEAAAMTAASALAVTWADPVVVFDAEGAQAAVVAGGPPALPKDVPAGPADDSMLARAIEAHGNGLAWVSDADRLKMVFTRTLPDGRVAKHTYARRGTDLYLAIEAVKGDVKPSRTLVLGEAAWLWEGTAQGTPQDLQRARETIERFGPTAVVPVVLGLDRAATDHPELVGLSARGTAKVGDEVCEVTGRPAGGPDVMIAYGAKDGLIRRIALDGGARVHEYAEYFEAAPGVQVPRAVASIVDGTPRDRVVIQEIVAGGDLPDAWFQAP